MKIKTIKNKQGMLARNWIIIVVLIGMLFTASTYWIGAWNDKYSPIENSNFSNSYNSINEMSSTVNQMETKLQADTKITGIGFLDFIVNGGYQVLINVLSIPSILTGFINDVGGQFGIPRVYIDGFIVIIIVSAIFGVIGAIFRRKT